MEEVTLNIDNNDTLDNENNLTEINLSDKPSVNFGGGIELLMNDKIKEKSNEPSISIGDLDDLDKELDNVKIDNDDNFINDKPDEDAKKGGLFKNIPFFNKKSKNNSNDDLDLNEDITSNINDIKIGGSTANMNSNKTWDGYKPIETNTSFVKEAEQQNKKDTLKEKFEILRKLEILEQKGVNLTKKYSMESSLAEMKGEYENILAEKERKNSVKFQGKVLTAIITGMEFLNSKFDPFDIKLEGWSEQINENLDDYDEIFGELHEKYKSKAKMAPELKLLFQLGASGMMIHMTNTMFKSAIPGMDDIMKQNPDLMQQFTQAAVNTMGETNPGVSNFMNTFGSSKNQQPQPPSPRMQSTSFNQPFHNDLPPSPRMTQASQSARSVQIEKNKSRPEMNGPADISNLLSGLKTQINIDNEVTNNSTISVEELDLSNKKSSNKQPKSRRKNKSDRTTVSLEL